ncbi:ATP-binding protein [Chitinophaga sp. GCM10012297]|uniref:histidine kinase n=1 Tax=Chitinophaga chungangae TaxID=2821488 RepID=A0ABS3YH23_9BACT|nr:hybrid sensor histidine kinase/response regulator [Chitinophaga chungangae]MBO9153995.1 response regulator [Chitinophaga chungangae]
MEPLQFFKRWFATVSQAGRSVVHAGASGLEEDARKKVLLVNTLCCITAILAFAVGYVFYRATGLPRIYIPAAIEGALFTFIIALNGLRRYGAASVGLLLVHCAGALYFSMLLGQLMNFSLIVVFLFGLCFLVYSQKRQRILGLAATAFTLVFLELNFYFHFFSPIEISLRNQFLFRWIAMPSFLLFDALVLYYYIRENKRLFQQVKMVVFKTTHELRNHLTSNSILLELLKNDAKENPDLERIRPYIDQLSVINAGMSNVVSNVLSMGEIEGGKMDELENHTFHIRPFLNNIAGIHRIKARLKGVVIKLHIDKGIPPIIVSDSHQLNIVITNLLSNAVKYADENSEITMKVLTADAFFRISVSNQCPEIPGDKLKYLFEKFFTAKTDHQEGSGLGLYIVKNIVDNFGGACGVKSNARETTFTVKLPLKTGHPCNLPEEHDNYIYRMENALVLFAEDDLMNHRLLFNLLQSFGCTVSGSINGGQLIETLGQCNILPDCILLDAQMPEMGGLQTLRYIRSHPVFQDIPVIFITARTDNKDELLEAGASAVVPKPFDKKTLFSVISRHLQSVNADHY